jgi:ceramide glucosyltransferase
VQALSLVFAALADIGAIYYILSAWALASHFRSCRKSSLELKEPPSVSVLKPVAGLDADAATNFRSFFAQDYSNYEVLFGALEPDDLALPALRETAAAFGRAAVYTGSDIEGTNKKVRILQNLAKQAMGEVLVITDADVRVKPEFLETITAPFADKQVGMVTCMYRGIGDKTVADSLEGLYMTCEFAPGVACANALGVPFGLGAAIAIRRQVLEKIGGFESIADYLADDFQLGLRTIQAGYRVELSRHVVDIILSGESLKNVLAREIRWRRTTRVSRPSGHFGMIFTFGFAHALTFWLASGLSTPGLATLAGVTAIRMVTAYITSEVCLNDRRSVRRLYLLPARDVISFGTWIAGYLSSRVEWRGRKLKLTRDGRMKVVG